MTVDIYGGRDPNDLGLYSYAEVGRWLKMPASTVIDKIKAHRPYGEKRKQVSFKELYELWAMREDKTQHCWFERKSLLEEYPVIFHPMYGIDINPRVSFGRPCLSGTGTKTDIVALRVEAGETPQEVADDYGLPLALVESAVAFEAATKPRRARRWEGVEE